MPEKEPLNPVESELQETLRVLKPVRPHFELSGIALEAERRQGRRQVRIWQCIAAALAIGLALSLLPRARPRTFEKLADEKPVDLPVPHPRPALIGPQAAPPSQPSQESTETPIIPSGDEYVAVRSRVLAFGVDALFPRPSATYPMPPIQAFEPPRSDVNPPSLFDFFNLSRNGGRS